MYLGIGILHLVKLKLSCFSPGEHAKYIYMVINTRNNFCAVQQPYARLVEEGFRSKNGSSQWQDTALALN